MEGCHVIVFISQNRNPNFPQTLAATINLHGSRRRFWPPSTPPHLFIRTAAATATRHLHHDHLLRSASFTLHHPSRLHRSSVHYCSTVCTATPETKWQQSPWMKRRSGAATTCIRSKKTNHHRGSHRKTPSLQCASHHAGKHCWTNTFRFTATANSSSSRTTMVAASRPATTTFEDLAAAPPQRTTKPRRSSRVGATTIRRSSRHCRSHKPPWNPKRSKP